jgi:exopolysaccharide production protein ExoZ
MMGSQQKLGSVHGLRGIAALIVVLMHFSSFLQPVAPQLSTFLSNGYLGVDVFFVISGFIIYISTEEPSTRHSLTFFVRRFCRVALPAWVALALCVAIQPPYFKDLILSVLFIPLQNAAPPFYGYSVLIVAWTLTYELVFYLIFSIALSFGWGRRHRGVMATFLIVVLYALSQGKDCCSLDPYSAPLFILDGLRFPDQLLSIPGNPISLEFAVGIFLGWVYVNNRLTRTGATALLLTAPLTFYLIVKFQYVAGHGLDRGGILAAAIVLYILCLEAWNDNRGQANSNQPRRGRDFNVALLLLGEISYSMYLLHPSIKGLVLKLQASVPAFSSASMNVVAFGVALVLTLVGSAVFYRWVELPAQRLGRTLAAYIRSKPFLVGALTKTEKPGM